MVRPLAYRRYYNENTFQRKGRAIKVPFLDMLFYISQDLRVQLDLLKVCKATHPGGFLAYKKHLDYLIK